MRLLCNINHVLNRNVGFLQEYELKRELAPELEKIFMALSESTYTWITEKSHTGAKYYKTHRSFMEPERKRGFPAACLRPRNPAKLTDAVCKNKRNHACRVLVTRHAHL